MSAKGLEKSVRRILKNCIQRIQELGTVMIGVTPRRTCASDVKTGENLHCQLKASVGSRNRAR